MNVKTFITSESDGSSPTTEDDKQVFTVWGSGPAFLWAVTWWRDDTAMHDLLYSVGGAPTAERIGEMFTFRIHHCLSNSPSVLNASLPVPATNVQSGAPARFISARSWPVEPLDIVDTTGAGDCFIAGFIYGLTHHLGIAR